MGDAGGAEMRQPYKILMADDEPDLEPLVLQRMRHKIRSGEYSFVFAHNGVEALDMLVEDQDIVISDINMPHMDGLTLLEQIPKVDPSIRAVILSACGDMKNIRTAMRRGAFDFITKPIDFEDLHETIERTLGTISMPGGRRCRLATRTSRRKAETDASASPDPEAVN